MRYLNRIILINSAQIKFADINVDGNVHFIGTQGVGKSTLLRAILFFYNADTLKLGISREKKSFTEYYFPYANSYIIYEVSRTEGKYCVLAYKSQNKIAFRFYDGGFDRNHFINEEGKAFESWDKVGEQLNKQKINYTTRKIDSYEEYRDILYGNGDGTRKELKRYALLESKEYQNIPRTIQNVFLNSKLEAEFIKQTIIASLQNDIRIELSNYAHHLKGFETQLNDIKKFNDTKTFNQADAISKLHIAIKHLEKEKAKLAKELSWTLNDNKEQEPLLTDKLNSQKEKQHILNAKRDKLIEAFKAKEKKIIAEISVFDDKLKTAKKKLEEYEKLNIAQMIQAVGKKKVLESEQKNLLDEKELLSTQFKELTQKYQALVKGLDNQFAEFANNKQLEKLQLKEQFQKLKEDSRHYYDKLIVEIKAHHKNEMELANESLEDKKRNTTDLKIQREGIKHKRFFEQEIEDTKNQIKQTETQALKLNTDVNNHRQEIENLQKQWEMDDKSLQQNLEREKEKLDEKVVLIQKEIDNIQSNIDNSKGSMYGWLGDNYPGWEKTIGKVIDDKSVLFNLNLEPKLIGDNKNSFYGIELNLSEIKKKVKTVADYEKEKEKGSVEIWNIHKKIKVLTDKFNTDKDKLKSKYQPKIREKKELVKEHDYLVGQNKSKLDNATVKLGELMRNAETEKKATLETIGNDIAKATEDELETKQELKKIEEEINKSTKTKEKERDKKIETELNKVNQAITVLEAEVQAKQTEIQERKEVINEQQKKESANKGADTERLSAIEKRLDIVKTSLDYIDKSRDKVAEYNKDKRELFDKTDEFKNDKQQLEKKLQQEELKQQQQQEATIAELETIKIIIEELSQTLAHIEDDNKAFTLFLTTECCKSIQDYFLIVTDEYQNTHRAKALIDEIQEIHYDKLNNRTDEIKKAINDFSAKFSDDNIFKFKKHLSEAKDFVNFAAELSDFIDEEKIKVLEKQVNERFSFIIQTIGKETTDLVSKEGEIQNVITKINKDFIERNFAGVIKKIELMLDTSKNEVVQLLKLIKKFNDENAFDLGPANLFSSNDQDSQNKKAVDLLKQFVKKIGELKRDYISLSDSFELKFRIEENNNDTGWVEKLSNVGSEGTDILVKAMINIMLLNVFKDGASKRFKDFQLHCMMDEIGKLHPTNVRGILKFANDRNILLINSSPTENDALAFKHIYKLQKDDKSITKVKRILTQYATE